VSSWKALAQVVAPRVLEDARRVSETLTELGVPHALVGGLAVGLHGHPRATRDVDFLVGPAAFATTTPLLTLREGWPARPPGRDKERHQGEYRSGPGRQGRRPTAGHGTGANSIVTPTWSESTLPSSSIASITIV